MCPVRKIVSWVVNSIAGLEFYFIFIYNILFLFTFIFSFLRSGVEKNAALSFATQYAMPAELGGKWGTECLNNRFPLPILLCAGYSMKLIIYFIVTVVEHHLPANTMVVGSIITRQNGLFYFFCLVKSKGGVKLRHLHAMSRIRAINEEWDVTVFTFL